MALWWHHRPGGSWGSPAGWLTQVAWVSTHPSSFRKFNGGICSVHHYRYAWLKTLRVTERDTVMLSEIANIRAYYYQSGVRASARNKSSSYGAMLTSATSVYTCWESESGLGFHNQSFIFSWCMFAYALFPSLANIFKKRSCCGFTEDKDINMVIREIITCASLYCFSVLACKIRITIK